MARRAEVAAAADAGKTVLEPRAIQQPSRCPARRRAQGAVGGLEALLVYPLERLEVYPFFGVGCYVAAGRFDGFWEVHLSPWDMAAGALMVLETRGIVTDYSGGPFRIEGGQILATNGRLHAEMRAILADAEEPRSSTGTGVARTPPA